jgi:uncharacterized protein YoxC
MVEYSLSRIERILKLTQFMLKNNLVEDIQPKFGRLSTLITWVKKLMIRLEKLITNSDSELTPHSY